MLQSAGSMRLDLPGQTEFIDANKDQKKDGELKMALAQATARKLIKLRSKEDIDKEIVRHCGSEFSKNFCFGDTFGGKEVEPLIAGNQLSAALLNYVNAGKDKFDKGYRLQMTLLLERSVFKIIFDGHPKALRRIEQAKINQTIMEKFEETMKTMFGDEPSNEEDAETSEKSSNSDNEDVSAHGEKAHEQSVVAGDFEAHMESASDTEESNQTPMKKLRKLVQYLTHTENGSSSDEE